MEQLTDIQEQILNGHLLGDGHIERTRTKNARFSISRKSTDKDYLLWSVKHFENFIYSSGVKERDRYNKDTQRTQHCIELRTKASPIFTEYHNQWYNNHKKIIPPDLTLTPLTLAVWFCDDGTLRYHSRNISLTLATNSFSYQEDCFLLKQLQDICGEKIQIYPQRTNQFVISSSRSKEINNFLDYIMPVFPPLNRKLEKIKDYDLITSRIIMNDNIQEEINFYKKPEEILPDCIYCNENNVSKLGKDKGEKQRFFCKNCQKSFLILSDYERLVDYRPPCIFCNSNRIVKSSKWKGKQRYGCSNCHKTFMDINDYQITPKLTIDHQVCE